MPEQINQQTFYKLGGGYSLTRLNSAECSLMFRNSDRQLLAVLSGCGNKITAIAPYRDYQLSAAEYKLLRRFVLTRGFGLNVETAAVLGLSVLRYADGREEFVPPRRLRKKIADASELEYLHVGGLRRHTLVLPDFCRINLINLSRAEIKKLIIGVNCGAQVDLRDNQHIAAVRVGKSFNGSLNLSRSTVESVAIADNCRCDLAVFDSKRCFTLNIGDVYSGNLHIKNSCFHNIAVGYYSYAALRLTDNWGRRDVVVGDSFRGQIYMDNVNVGLLKVGKDCKGAVNILGGSRRCCKIELGNEFAGVLDLRGPSNVQLLNIGSYARGKFNLLGAEWIRQVKFGSFYAGYADFSDSKVEYVSAGEGCGGEMVFSGCDGLKLLQLPRHRNSVLVLDHKPLEIRSSGNVLYYCFVPGAAENFAYPPLYQKIFRGIRGIFAAHSG